MRFTCTIHQHKIAPVALGQYPSRRCDGSRKRTTAIGLLPKCCYLYLGLLWRDAGAVGLLHFAMRWRAGRPRLFFGTHMYTLDWLVAKRAFKVTRDDFMLPKIMAVWDRPHAVNIDTHVDHMHVFPVLLDMLDHNARLVFQAQLVGQALDGFALLIVGEAFTGRCIDGGVIQGPA